MHRSRAPSIAPGTFFVALSWADCITNMAGVNLRQAQVKLKASGADVVFDASTPKFEAQAIRKMFNLNWKPMHFVGTHVCFCKLMASQFRSTSGTNLDVGNDRHDERGSELIIR
jgi:hypothetical protein